MPQVIQLVQLVSFPGNNTGIYSVPGITAANTLVWGVAASDDFSSPNFNYSPINVILAPAWINPTLGWYSTSGQIIDPAAVDLTDDYVIWLVFPGGF